VHLLDGHLGKIKGEIAKEETGTQIIPSPKVSAEEIIERDEKVVLNPNPLPTTSIQVDTSTPDPTPTRMQRFQAFRQDAYKEYGTLFGLGYIFIGFPLVRFFDAFDDMLDCNTLGGESLGVPIFYSPNNGNSHHAAISLASAPAVAIFLGPFTASCGLSSLPHCKNDGCGEYQPSSF